MVNFTNDDVIAYIYNELPIAQFMAFELALANSWSLREKVAMLKETKMQLTATIVNESPSQSCIDRILEYARTPVASL